MERAFANSVISNYRAQCLRDRKVKLALTDDEIFAVIQEVGLVGETPEDNEEAILDGLEQAEQGRHDSSSPVDEHRTMVHVYADWNRGALRSDVELTNMVNELCKAQVIMQLLDAGEAVRMFCQHHIDLMQRALDARRGS